MSRERLIETPPAGVEGWREVWREDVNYPPENVGVFGRFLHRVVLPSIRGWLQPRLDRQRDFNLVTLDLLDDARSELQQIAAGLRKDLQDVRADLLSDIAKVRELLPLIAGRNDALMSALDQKLEASAARLRDLSLPILSSSSAPSLREDFVYRRLEEALRGSEAEVRRELTPYLELARTHSPLLDIGCGRGELLKMCREAGVEARGMDSNERSVADLRSKGLNVSVAGIPQCFESIQPGTVGSIFASHVVEHLPFPLLVSLFAGAAASLRLRGLLMIETPNARSLVASSSEFWRDPTHLAPRHEAALITLGREVGFALERIETLHPFTAGELLHTSSSDPEIQRLVENLNGRLFGNQDLRLILRKA